ncbi:hypothetical protein LMG16407_02762 [Pandoraea apista]|nr:hypothetical protein LMG16407_02762 [Pandoraea apista]
MATDQVRGTARAATLAQAGAGGAPASGGAVLRQACAGWSARALRSRTAVPADRRTATGVGRDSGRPSGTASDAASLTGRRGQRQDDHCSAGGGAGHRRRFSGGHHGTDRDSCGTASAQALGVAHAAGRGGRVAGRQHEGERETRGAGARGERRGTTRHWHARHHSGHGHIRASGHGGRRRTTPLRGGATSGLAQQDADGRRRPERHAASVDDERHAHSAHARHDLLRRPRCLCDRRVAPGPQPGRYETDQRLAPPRSDRPRSRGGAGRASGVLGLSADRGKRGAAIADGRRHARPIGGGAARTACGARPWAIVPGGEGRGDGRLHAWRHASAGGNHGHRSGRGCP